MLGGLLGFLDFDERLRRVPCTVIVHPFHPSCNYSWFLQFRDGFGFGTKVYTPIIVVAALLRKKNRGATLLFMGLMSSLTIPVNCNARKLLGINSPLIVFASGAISGGTAVFFEDRGRRRELAIYTSSQAADALWRMLHSRGVVPMLPYGDVAVFSAAAAVLHYFYHRDTASLGNVRTILSTLQGPFDSRDFASSPTSNSTCCCYHNTPETPSVTECAMYALAGLARGAACGLAVRGSFAFVSNLVARRMYRAPHRALVRSVLDDSVRRFAAFCGLFVFLWRAVPCFLPRLLRSVGLAIAPAATSLVAGAVAGLSLLVARNVDITLYFMSKACEALFTRFALPRLPLWLLLLPHPEKLLFAATCGFLFMQSVLEPYNLRHSYFQFLLSASNGRYRNFEPIVRLWRPVLFQNSGFSYSNFK